VNPVKTHRLLPTPSTREFTVPASVPAYLGSWHVPTAGVATVAAVAAAATAAGTKRHAAQVMAQSATNAFAAAKASTNPIGTKTISTKTISTKALPALQGSSLRRSPA
jgi:hypothetical protein